jgi:hypothetical protein
MTRYNDISLSLSFFLSRSISLSVEKRGRDKYNSMGLFRKEKGRKEVVDDVIFFTSYKENRKSSF